LSSQTTHPTSLSRPRNQPRGIRRVLVVRTDGTSRNSGPFPEGCRRAQRADRVATT
jgi:hypothetical protein